MQMIFQRLAARLPAVKIAGCDLSSGCLLWLLWLFLPLCSSGLPSRFWCPQSFDVHAWRRANCSKIEHAYLFQVLPATTVLPPAQSVKWIVSDTACCVVTCGSGFDLPCALIPWVSDNQWRRFITVCMANINLQHSAGWVVLWLCYRLWLYRHRFRCIYSSQTTLPTFACEPAV